MGTWRGALALLLLVPALAPPAEAATYTWQILDTTNQPRGNPSAGVPAEFHVSDTVRLRLFLLPDSSFTVTKTFRLYREGVYRFSIGSGETIPLTGGVQTVITQDWFTNTLSTGDRGHWRAEFDLPTQTLVALVDLDHAPDFIVTFLSISHHRLPGNANTVHDGTEKTVKGCVINQGLDLTPANVDVGLYFRTPADPVVNANGAAPGTPNWNPGHVVLTQNVKFGFPNSLCTNRGINSPGWYVEFFYDAKTKLADGSPAMSRLGLRGDPANVVWESNDLNNDRELESTIQPSDFLP